MNTPAFDAEACHRATREKVAGIFGWAGNNVRLDDRQLFYVELVSRTGSLAKGRHLVDLGPGLAAFGPVVREMGMEVTLVDDFGGGGCVDVARQDVTQRFLDQFRNTLGIRIEEMDFLTRPLPLGNSSVDIITCFHSLEHWHHSPKPLFREIVRVLKPGGHLIIATPNAANIRKRFFVPFGHNIWSSLDEWYHEGDPVFRGHVREPIARDLQILLEWNHLELVDTIGRNFIGRDSLALQFLPRRLVHSVAVAADYLLRLFPTLCSDIHVVGRKR